MGLAFQCLQPLGQAVEVAGLGPQDPGLDGVEDDVRHAEFFGFGRPGTAVRGPGHQHDGDVLGLLKTADVAGGFQPADIRHQYVQQHERDVAVQQGLEGPLAARSG